jgi:hypothetical protein
MNKILMMIMVVMILGLTASNVSADCAVHDKGLNIEYNELSAAEFFYGIPIENRIDVTLANGRARAVVNENTDEAADLLSTAEFFYGYLIPDRLETARGAYELNACNRNVEKIIVSAVYDPAIFFGYEDAGSCINC